MIKRKSRQFYRKLRKRRTGKISGTSSKPRLTVYKSTKEIYAQIIDDLAGTTLASASSIDKDIKGKAKKGIQKAKFVGQLLAERAVNAGIKQVTFDRAGYKYHGAVKELAQAAREKGLKF